MGRYKPLVSRATWKEICELYRDLVQENLALKTRTPFLPIAESGFGEDGTVSVVVCGISVGEAESSSCDYSARVRELGAHFDGWLKADVKARGFWNDVLTVRSALLEGGNSSKVKMGWANILPINANRSGSSAQPDATLRARQKNVSSRVWAELFRDSRADAIVATFGQQNFRPDREHPGSGQFVMNEQIWIRRPLSSEPAIIWANHANGRRGAGTVQAHDIAATLMQLLPKK